MTTLIDTSPDKIERRNNGKYLFTYANGQDVETLPIGAKFIVVYEPNICNANGRVVLYEIVPGPGDWASNARRIRGYQYALRNAGLALNIAHVDCTTIESGAVAYRQLIDAHPGITGICAVNDSMAIGAIRTAQAEGKSIPDDLSVVGFDDIGWASLNNPPLTTMSIPKRQIGKEAANRMLISLSDPDAQPTEVIVSVHFVHRASTKSNLERERRVATQ